MDNNAAPAFPSAASEGIDWGGSSAEDGTIMNTTETLSSNVHTGLPNPSTGPARCSLVKGDYLYFHYGCDGQDDRGWGCGYRTVQTMASWLRRGSSAFPPRIGDMQRALVTMGDKPGSFSGSREWIGTVEAALILDYFYDAPCKVVHVRGGGGELERVAVEELHRHFAKHGAPAMMGGDRDNSSRGILGVCSGDSGGSCLLVADPHYYGGPLEKGELQRRGWVAWKSVSSLDQCSFYNVCLPQAASRPSDRPFCSLPPDVSL